MINFHPKRGTVLICDFTGFKPPEMVKKRPVVVLSPRYRRHTGLCLVVPFSTVAPEEVEPHHYRIPPGTYAFLDPAKTTWAKCDMLAHVSFERLERFWLNGRAETPQLNANDMKGIEKSVLCALQIDLAKVPVVS
jgi:mRNA interferase MazF